MRTEEKTDRTRLENALSRLHSESTQNIQSGGRAPPMLSSSPLDVIASELNKTVLRRKLIFESEAGDILELDVAGRKVLEVQIHTSPADPTSVLRRRSKEAREIEKHIEEFGNAAGKILSCSVRTVDETPSSNSTTPGLPKDLQSDNFEPSALAEYLADLEICAIAFIVFVDGQERIEWGSQNMITRLRDCPKNNNGAMNSCVVWFDTSNRGLAIAKARIADTVVWAAVDAANLLDLHTSWASLELLETAAHQ